MVIVFCQAKLVCFLSFVQLMHRVMRLDLEIRKVFIIVVLRTLPLLSQH